LNTILEPTFVEILVALFSGESWIAFALVAADRVPACGVLGIARVRQDSVHVLFAPHALEARVAAALAEDAVADGGGGVEEDAAGSAAAIVEARSGRIATRSHESRSALAIKAAHAIATSASVQTFHRILGFALRRFRALVDVDLAVGPFEALFALADESSGVGAILDAGGAIGARR